MYCSNLILIVFYFIHYAFCNDKIVDQNFIEDTNYQQSNTILFLDNENKLYSNYYNQKAKLLNSFIPLKDSNILGSFSNDTVFFIGTEHLNNSFINNNKKQSLKNILIVDDANWRFHHSMALHDGSIEIYSMSYRELNNNNYLSISIHTLNQKTNFSDVIYLKQYPQITYSSNVVIDPNQIKNFKFCHDKVNNVYIALVQNKDNDTVVVQFREYVLEIYTIDTNEIQFNSIIFGNYRKFLILYGVNNNGSSQILQSYNLISNSSNTEMILTNITHQYNIVKTNDPQIFSFYKESESNLSNNVIVSCHLGESVNCQTKEIFLYSGIKSFSQAHPPINSIYLTYIAPSNKCANKAVLITIIVVPIISAILLSILGLIIYIRFFKKSATINQSLNYNNIINNNQYKKDYEFEKENEFDREEGAGYIKQ
ncbi:hypothetical protein DICPUDRAFT_159427 [Dictyostelium purpureum]|uniref:Transmembrane protein n=1 Tax=Dictyostelium purpureum TaxID=5786 RepID=F1A437_DICPU|nr:uncharacterized protein DICPUDRAFT_159427 [Dictyostelium purpureum]EGC29047.1 hypothetical protein DICPUDRAFT_159427 [Dictyostelium purpureum]|eukprot:XP_003294431.1 hypothetical protein DICPUDRAFT_159427 [Dictyostelium purpureum]